MKISTEMLRQVINIIEVEIYGQKNTEEVREDAEEKLRRFEVSGLSQSGNPKVIFGLTR